METALESWETCSGSVGNKVFNEIEFKKIFISLTKIRKLQAKIARGDFVRDDPTGFKQKLLIVN